MKKLKDLHVECGGLSGWLFEVGDFQHKFSRTITIHLYMDHNSNHFFEFSFSSKKNTFLSRFITLKSKKKKLIVYSKCLTHALPLPNQPLQDDVVLCISHGCCFFFQIYKLFILLLSLLLSLFPFKAEKNKRKKKQPITSTLVIGKNSSKFHLALVVIRCCYRFIQPEVFKFGFFTIIFFFHKKDNFSRQESQFFLLLSSSSENIQSIAFGETWKRCYNLFMLMVIPNDHLQSCFRVLR